VNREIDVVPWRSCRVCSRCSRGNPGAPRAH
jgi:hypothetical protein